MHLLLFLLFPAVELYLLVKVGAYTGALNMVLWVFASALIGMWAARAQGQEAMYRARADLAAGRVPQNTFLDGLLLFFGGVLLILPGLISDAVGLFLLIPPCRAWASAALARYLTARQGQPSGASRVIFFRSGPFPGGPFPDGQAGPFGPQAGPHTPENAPEKDREPRQATIIDSTAIEISSSENGPTNRDGEGGNGTGKRP